MTATASKKSPRAAPPLVLNGERLTRRAVVQVARQGRLIQLDPSALRRVARAATFLANKLKQNEPLYGVTTGFGSNADRILKSDKPGVAHSLVAELQRNLLISHAVGMGEPLSEELTRAMLVIRINTLLRGHSGIRTATLKLMAELLNRRICPLVPELGSVGASGDLAPLSHLALPLIGEGQVRYRGEICSALMALESEKLAPIELGPKEGLALNNGTTLMLAYGVFALDELEYLLKLSDLVAATSLEAFAARSAAFDKRVHDLRPHPGQSATASNLRALLHGSSLIDIAFHRVPRFSPLTPASWAPNESIARSFDVRWDYVLPAERVGREAFYSQQLPFRGGKKVQPQDAYSLRCIPQVHGAVKDAWAQATRVIDIELNSVTDNPLIFPNSDESEGQSVISAGNFHGMPLALAMSYLKAAIPVLASISERRTNKLLDPATNDGLPPFLSSNEDGTDSGLMIVQYTAAAIVNDLASRANPCSVYSLPTSANTEDHVSMGANEARHAFAMVHDLRRVLALELLVATQALDCRLQILGAAHAVAAQLGVQTLRSKIRNLSPAKQEDAAQLAQELKLLQEDLKRLNNVQPSTSIQQLLKLVRDHGIAFVGRDRLLTPDIEAIDRLVASRAPLQALAPGIELELR